jgi:hypothetical protein
MRGVRNDLGAPGRCGRVYPIGLVLAVIASGCQEPGQPGPMERAGVQIDRTMGRAQESVGDLSQRVGRSLNQAGQSAGDAANNAGTSVHNWLAPAKKGDQDPAPTGATQPSAQNPE